MLIYRELYLEKNEIRLTTLLSLKPRESKADGHSDACLNRQDIIGCRLEYLSLDDYILEYSTFLDVNAPGRSTYALALLWDYVRGTDEVREFMN
jgi:hypothetical protein